jgi:hypothetical protein
MIKYYKSTSWNFNNNQSWFNQNSGNIFQSSHINRMCQCAIYDPVILQVIYCVGIITCAVFVFDVLNYMLSSLVTTCISVELVDSLPHSLCRLCYLEFTVY